jgi:hypothetical protein
MSAQASIEPTNFVSTQGAETMCGSTLDNLIRTNASRMLRDTDLWRRYSNTGYSHAGFYPRAGMTF